MFLDYGFVTENNLLATVPEMGYYFTISLQMWIESYSGGNKYGYSEFLRFTSTEKDCCSSGDRIPAIFVNKNGFIHVTSQVGTNGNFYRNFRLPSKQWIKIEIKQYPDNEQVQNMEYLFNYLDSSKLQLFTMLLDNLRDGHQWKE